MGKNLPSNAGDVGSMPGQGTKILHATGQLSLHMQLLSLCALDPVCPRLRPDAAKEVNTLIQEIEMEMVVDKCIFKSHISLAT